VKAPPAPPDEFAEIKKQIATCKEWNQGRLEREALRKEALILDGDRTPVDVVWRRTRALLEDIQGMKGARTSRRKRGSWRG